MVRNNIPILAVLACAYLGVKSLLQRLTSIRRISFLFTASILFILGLHGANLLKILVILSINYLIAILLGSSKLNPLFTWIFNMGVLFAIERNNGYKFSSLSETLASLVCPALVRGGRSLINFCTIGRFIWNIPEVVYTIQHQYAAFGIIQYGLSLGSKKTTVNRSECT